MAHNVSWTEYQSDNWQLIPQEHYEPNMASGLIRIKKAFLDQLPQNVCFKVHDVQMIDNRGQFPASLINKFEDAVDATTWVHATMGGGNASNIEIGTFSDELWRLPPVDVEAGQPHCVVSTPEMYDSFSGNAYLGNRIYVQSRVEDVDTGAHCSVAVSFSLLNSLGLPSVLANAPDGITILEAKMELSTSGMTITKSGEPPVEADIAYSFVGLTGLDSFEVLGTIPGAANGQNVVDCTEIMQIMFAERATGKYAYGFGAIFLPDMGIEIPGPPGVTSIPDESCPLDTTNGFIRDESWNIIYTWGGISVGNIWIKINYNGTDKQDTIQPRFPSMANLAP